MQIPVPVLLVMLAAIVVIGALMMLHGPGGSWLGYVVGAVMLAISVGLATRLRPRRP